MSIPTPATRSPNIYIYAVEKLEIQVDYINISLTSSIFKESIPMIEKSLVRSGIKKRDIHLIKDHEIFEPPEFQNGVAILVPGARSATNLVKCLFHVSGAIKKAVSNGMSYYGICAGAIAACKNLIIHRPDTSHFDYGLACSGEGFEYQYHPLALLDVQAECPNFKIARGEEPRKKLADVLYGEKELEVVYLDSPCFSKLSKTIKVVARYKETDTRPKKDLDKRVAAVIYGQYGKGFVGLFGPHFELGQHDLLKNAYIRGGLLSDVAKSSASSYTKNTTTKLRPACISNSSPIPNLHRAKVARNTYHKSFSLNSSCRKVPTREDWLSKQEAPKREFWFSGVTVIHIIKRKG